MIKYWTVPLLALGFIFLINPANATPVYWNLFNIEGESQVDSVYITYNSLNDMLNDTNRIGAFTPDNVGGAAQNVVGSGSDGMTYWNLFNVEEESQANSVYITYDSLNDMLNDTNRTGAFSPDSVGGAAQNVVGSGSDGMTYWNLFNIEGESQADSIYITYDSLFDMLNDDNRTGAFSPDSVGGAAQNVVGSGSDGMTYWNLFNIEGESQADSIYITYDSLFDMLNDTNRTGAFTPDSVGGAAHNVVGSGAFVMAATTVPEPTTMALFGLGGLGIILRRRKTKGTH